MAAASSSASPLYLSAPLYTWEVSGEDHVSYDEFHQRVLHQQPEGFFAIDIAKEGLARDGLLVKFRPVRAIRFSPDGSYFAYLADTKPPTMGAVNVLHPETIDVPVPLRTAGGDWTILAFFWLPAVYVEFADLVVVSTMGIDVYRFTYDTLTVKHLRRFPATASICWYESSSGFVVLATGPRTLQPYLLYCKTPTKLPKFELNLQRHGSLEAQDVAIMTLYEWTFCIHMDTMAGRVALRSLSGPHPADIVLDVQGPGPLRLSRVDNLLVVHRLDKCISLIFDIKQGKTLTPICRPAPLAVRHEGSGPDDYAGGGLLSLGSGMRGVGVVGEVEGHGEDDAVSVTDSHSSVELYSPQWRFVSADMIVDEGAGVVYRLELNMDAVADELMQISKVEVVRVLLRRINCRPRVVSTLRKALDQQAPLEDLALLFSVLNQVYRAAIERVPHKVAAATTRRATVSLDMLLQFVGQQTILTEKDVVLEVMYPYLLAIAKAPPNAPILELAYQRRFGPPTQPAAPAAAREGDGGGGDGEGEKGMDELKSDGVPYLMSVALEYMRSLLNLQILPHRILQAFVFEVGVFFEQDSLLQQLLQYHVLLDSIDLAQRLFGLWKRTGYAWARQACLDMSLRLREWSLIADVLIDLKEYLDVVPMLRRHGVSTYPIKEFLHKVADDVEAQQADPFVLPHVLESVRAWRRDSQENPSKVPPPNLRECGLWLPDIRFGDEDSAAPGHSSIAGYHGRDRPRLSPAGISGTTSTSNPHPHHPHGQPDSSKWSSPGLSSRSAADSPPLTHLDHHAEGGLGEERKAEGGDESKLGG
ncbi:unnamed protein product [Vitrella brassicaformis CCMP3155]|uniref:Mic1 domain-containing protein n=2 Tax=Vitrella brassicaformis TaxID=1169539 RepID=A0A0G4EK70_VITBC|nr:unnamed protein product [Vitrella brassicaformis CCMP3155]|eukprot:CEL96954.1 unnamed protein product [Vitrella brassicaformis CCMP3155]